jgi:2-polyprenyl-6-methoxyphenol hydroxylase-like FAD-dependent oxidoreductase
MGLTGMKVVVIGAGPGGLTLAHGLRRAGIDVAVYERDTALGRPQGVSLHLDERGASALRACLPPAHVAMLAATTGGPRGHTLNLSEVDGSLAATEGPARPGRQVHRPLLRAVLLTGLDDVVRFGAELTRFERQPGGPVRVWFADGRTDTADVLVGADGIGSAVRRRHLPGARVVDTGRRMLMGATPLRAVAGTGLPELVGDNAAAAHLPGTTMALGVLRFTRRPEAARRQWLPALGSGAVAGLEDYVMWALAVTQEQLGSASAWDTARMLAADLPPTLRQVVAEAWPDVTVALRIAMIPPPPAWAPGPVTLLGDAIRLAPGFGANLAMEDAHRLCTALAEASRGNLLDTIGAYESSFTADVVKASA